MTEETGGTFENDNLSLDFDKEFNLRYTDRLTAMLNNLTSKYISSSENAETQILSQNFENNFNNLINVPSIKTVDNMNKKNILAEQNLSLGAVYNRIAKLKKARREFFQNVNKIEEEKVSKKINKNREKNEQILEGINSLFKMLDNIKTSNSDSLHVKDSLLNSHKNFIVVKKIKEFNDGVPILKLKKEDFMEKAKKYMSKRQEQDYEEENKKSMGRDKISENILDRINQVKQTGENKFFNSLKNSTKNKSGKFFSTELSEIAENHKDFNYNNNSGENSKIFDNKKDKNKKIKNELKYEANKDTILYKKELQMRQPTFLKIANQNYSLSNANTYSPDRSKMRQIILNKKQHDNLISNSLTLPKVNIREISVETLPEKIDIYTKIKIRDIIGLAKLKNSRPPFK